MNTVNAVDLQEGFEMVDEMAKRLRGVVGMQVGDVPALIHQAADHIDALAAKLAEADALIEAQQKDYASNNVRFAEAEHRAKAAETKLTEVEAERDAIERQFCRMSDDYSAVHVALEAAEAAAQADYGAAIRSQIDGGDVLDAEVALAEFHATGGKTMAQVRAEIEGGDVLDDPRVRALVEAANKVSYLQSGGPCTGIQSEQWNAELRAALSSIEKETP